MRLELFDVKSRWLGLACDVTTLGALVEHQPRVIARGRLSNGDEVCGEIATDSLLERAMEALECV